MSTYDKLQVLQLITCVLQLIICGIGLYFQYRQIKKK